MADRDSSTRPAWLNNSLRILCDAGFAKVAREMGVEFEQAVAAEVERETAELRRTAEGLADDLLFARSDLAEVRATLARWEKWREGLLNAASLKALIAMLEQGPGEKP